MSKIYAPVISSIGDAINQAKMKRQNPVGIRCCLEVMEQIRAEFRQGFSVSYEDPTIPHISRLYGIPIYYGANVSEGFIIDTDGEA